MTAPTWSYDDLPTPNTDNEFINITNEVFAHRQEWISGKWDKVTEKNGYLLEERTLSNSRFKAYRTTGLLHNVDIEKITEFTYDPDFKEKKEVTPDLIHQRNLKLVSNTIHTCLTHYATPFAISNREFVAIRAIRYNEDDSRLIVIQSVNVESVPVTEGFVRGVSKCAILLTPIDDVTVKMVNINHIDPKGYIPGFVVNMFRDRQLKTFENLQNFVVSS